MSKTASRCPFLLLRADTPMENMAEGVKEPPFQPPRIRIILDECFSQAAGISRGFTEGGASICSLCTGHQAGSGVLMGGAVRVLPVPWQVLCSVSGPQGCWDLHWPQHPRRGERPDRPSRHLAGLGFPGPDGGPEPRGGRGEGRAQDALAGRAHPGHPPALGPRRSCRRSAGAASSSGAWKRPESPHPGPASSPCGGCRAESPTCHPRRPTWGGPAGGEGEGVGVEKGGRDRGWGGEGGGVRPERERGGARRGGPGPGRAGVSRQPRREGAKSGRENQGDPRRPGRDW